MIEWGYVPTGVDQPTRTTFPTKMDPTVRVRNPSMGYLQCYECLRFLADYCFRLFFLWIVYVGPVHREIFGETLIFVSLVASHPSSPPKYLSLLSEMYDCVQHKQAIYPTVTAFPPPYFPSGPSRCASSTALVPSSTVLIASGSSRPNSSAVLACAAQIFPPLAAFAMPE